MLGREIPLGGGYADLLAVEPSGRLVLVEVKLASNAEARRAVVAQILAYAAYLRGISLESLEREILRSKLRTLGHETLAGLVESQDHEGSFEIERFNEALADSLSDGRFRLVLVLDDAPPELVRLVGYLESIATELAIDLVTVSACSVDGSRILVPQRVDPERQELQPRAGDEPGPKKAYPISPEEFAESIEDAPEDQQAPLRQAYEWAKSLETAGVARLFAYQGVTNRKTLLPYLPNKDAGLITIWNTAGTLSISFWRSVFERHAPDSITAIEKLVTSTKIGQGTTLNELNDDLLTALADAYRTAAS